MGKYDYEVSNMPTVDYKLYAEKLKKGCSSRKYGYIFKCLYSLARVLEVKYDLGVKTRKAYSDNDKNALLALADNEYSQAIIRLNSFYNAFKKLWERENKPNGFEIHDVRLGGLLCRLKNCRGTLRAYANGKIERVLELEEPILSVSRKEGKICDNDYASIVSFSEL